MDNGSRDTTLKPCRTLIRPATAHDITSVNKYKEERGRPSTAAANTWHDRSTQPTRPNSATYHTGRGRQKDEVDKQRRISISYVDGISENLDIIKSQLLLLSDGTRNAKIEDRVALPHLHRLKEAFFAASASDGVLTQDDFQQVLRSALNISSKFDDQIKALFMKIDTHSDGDITWDDFCTYMQLDYGEKEHLYLAGKQCAFNLPPVVHPSPHREQIVRINALSDGTYLVACQDGSVSFWTNTLQFKRVKTTSEPQSTGRSKQKWITDFVIMPRYNKLIFITGDREIQFYELSNFEHYCQITSLETVPIKLDYCATGADEGMILYGDAMGCVNIIAMSGVGETLRSWKEGLASVPLEVVASSSNTTFVRWAVHNDWVTQIKYCPELRSVFSSSNDHSTALVVGCAVGSTQFELPNARVGSARRSQVVSLTSPRKRVDADQTVFRVYKGVRSFGFCRERTIIATGGIDRIIRLWNPYVPTRPIGLLSGHNAPIFSVIVSSSEGRIYTISQDKMINVWDLQDQSNLVELRPKSHNIRGDLSAVYYNSTMKSLVVAAEGVSMLTIRAKQSMEGEIVLTHKHGITQTLYNPTFNQVITCTEGSVIKIWEFENGNPLFEFSNAHGNQAVTCMTFDLTGRRLISGGRDGLLRVWNYNSGLCIRKLTKTKPRQLKEVTDVMYCEVNKNKYIISVGWDRNISIYTDSNDIHSEQVPIQGWFTCHGVHSEDILSLGLLSPYLLATSSYDGEVVIWSMVSGGPILRLMSPRPREYSDISLDGDNSVCKVIFLRSRMGEKDAAILVASGPFGRIHFWNINHGGRIMGKFKASYAEGKAVSTMVISEDETLLYTGDQGGFVYVWDIEDYSRMVDEDEPPLLFYSWRAHVQLISGITLVHENFVITSSPDCTVRLWSSMGEYVGTFGQNQPWDVNNRLSWGHPMVPYDVLVDEFSLPEHPVTAKKRTMAEVVHEESLAGSDDDEEEMARKQAELAQMFTKAEFTVTDEDIAEELKRKEYITGTGKWLRFEKHRPRPVGVRPGSHHGIRCYGIDKDKSATRRPDWLGDEDPIDEILGHM